MLNAIFCNNLMLFKKSEYTLLFYLFIIAKLLKAFFIYSCWPSLDKDFYSTLCTGNFLALIKKYYNAHNPPTSRGELLTVNVAKCLHERH